MLFRSEGKTPERPGLNQNEALRSVAASELVSQKKASLRVGNQKLGGSGEKNVPKQWGNPKGEDVTLMRVVMLWPCY